MCVMIKRILVAIADDLLMIALCVIVTMGLFTMAYLAKNIGDVAGMLMPS